MLDRRVLPPTGFLSCLPGQMPRTNMPGLTEVLQNSFLGEAQNCSAPHPQREADIRFTSGSHVGSCGQTICQAFGISALRDKKSVQSKP